MIKILLRLTKNYSNQADFSTKEIRKHIIHLQVKHVRKDKLFLAESTKLKMMFSSYISIENAPKIYDNKCGKKATI